MESETKFEVDVKDEKLYFRIFDLTTCRQNEVYEPKKRVIKCGSFRGKVLQHCLCDYVLIQKLRDIFIKDNYTGKIGK